MSHVHTHHITTEKCRQPNTSACGSVMSAPYNVLSREMVKAVQANNREEVVRLCTVGEEVTGTYGTGDTLMHWAVSKDSR